MADTLTRKASSDMSPASSGLCESHRGCVSGMQHILHSAGFDLDHIVGQTKRQKLYEAQPGIALRNNLIAPSLTFKNCGSV